MIDKNSIVALFVANIGSIICIGGAIYMAANNISGWGWFLAIGAILAVSLTIKEKDE